MTKRILKNILALFIGLLFSWVIAEVVLRIYNPFSKRIRGNEIVLPARQEYRFSGVKIHGLSAEIVHTKNSIGFRGPELDEAKNKKRIFCVGGSTTECFYLNDGEDWPSVFSRQINKNGNQFWVNNAGLDGHSTRGHIVLLRDHISKLKPDYVLFLIGCNDLAAQDFSRFEHENLVSNMRLLQKFETFNLYLQFRLAAAAKKRGMGHQEVNLKNWPLCDTANWQKSTLNEGIESSFISRLSALAELTKKAGAVPIFITQPVLLGNANDPATGTYLGNLCFMTESGLHYRKKLNAINQTTVRFCIKNGYQCISADSLLLSSSDNYYDFFHYTKTGAESLGNLVAQEFLQTIKR